MNSRDNGSNSRNSGDSGASTGDSGGSGGGLSGVSAMMNRIRNHHYHYMMSMSGGSDSNDGSSRSLMGFHVNSSGSGSSSSGSSTNVSSNIGSGSGSSSGSNGSHDRNHGRLSSLLDDIFFVLLWCGIWLNVRFLLRKIDWTINCGMSSGIGSDSHYYHMIDYCSMHSGANVSWFMIFLPIVVVSIIITICSSYSLGIIQFYPQFHLQFPDFSDCKMEELLLFSAAPTAVVCLCWGSFWLDGKLNHSIAWILVVPMIEKLLAAALVLYRNWGGIDHWYSLIVCVLTFSLVWIEFGASVGMSWSLCILPVDCMVLALLCYVEFNTS